MPLQPFVTANKILHLPHESTQSRAHTGQEPKIPPVIFYLTGNPGLIGYYEKYLDLLATTKRPSHSDALGSNGTDRSTAKATTSDQCIIAGFSLGGFEVDPYEGREQTSSGTSTTPDHDEVDQLAYPPAFPRKDIYTLRDQIALCYARLTYLVERVHEHYHGDGSKGTSSEKVRVIIAGHSVGAYIALELVRTHHEKFQLALTTRQRTALSSPSPSTTSTSTPTSQTMTFDIISALLLTPTVIDLALSPSGIIATPLLTTIPFVVPQFLHYFSRGVSALLSRKNLEYAIHKFTGMKLNSPGLKTTAAFLSTNSGVKQALYMAGDELREMRENKWGDEVWGTARGGGAVTSENENKSENETENESEEEDGKKVSGVPRWTAPRLFFVFAQKDHWIADATRDTFLEELKDRNVDGAVKPTVVIDEEMGLVHGWCLEQSEFMAELSKGWIQQILQNS